MNTDFDSQIKTKLEHLSWTQIVTETYFALLFQIQNSLMVPEFRRSNTIEKKVFVPVMTADACTNGFFGKNDDYTYFCAYIYTVSF